MTGSGKVIVFGSYINSLINFRGNLLKDLVAAGYSVLALAPGHDEKTESQLRDIGVAFHSLSLSRTGINPVHDLRTLWEINSIIRQHRPEVLITYTIKPVMYGNLVASWYPVKKLALITGLGYLDTGKKTTVKRIMQGMIHALYRFSLRNLDFIAFQNPDDKEYFRQYRLVKNRTAQTITAGSGVDLTHYQRTPAVTEPVIFLLTARLIQSKGIMQYITAARVLKKDYGARVRFQLIGLIDKDNPDTISEDALQEAINEGSIDYLGYQSDVRGYLAACSVFVLPSYYREGTPRTILEALAMGKPIITTDNPGCRETVVDGKNGFLIPVKDAMALEKAMRHFIETPDSIRRMGGESYALAENKYDVKLVNQHLFTFANL